MVRDDKHAFIRSEKPTGGFSSLKLDEIYFYHFFILFILLLWPNATSTGQMKLPCGTVCNERTGNKAEQMAVLLSAPLDPQTTGERMRWERRQGAATGNPRATLAPSFPAVSTDRIVTAQSSFHINTSVRVHTALPVKLKNIWIFQQIIGPLVAMILGYF
jgi:hypothetical protein